MVALLLLCIFIVIVALALLFSRLGVLSSRITGLENRLQSALGLVAALEKTLRGNETRVPAAPKRGTPGRRKRPTLEKAASSHAELPLAAVPAPAAAPLPPPKSRTKEEWEALIGGKLLNRIGALALILGVAFFLQYAFANDWITEPVRVMIGVAFGMGLIAAAGRSAARGFQVFAQGLVGSGIAILYLSAYASFNYYHVVSQPFAFLFMSAVTVITFTQAFRYDSVVVALLGWLGGFLTPFLLSTGEVNTVGLFTYLALLNLGLLVVSWKKDGWMSIEPLSMAGTYLIYGLWLGETYADADFVPGLLFLGLFWLMFQAAHAVRLAGEVRGYRRFRLTVASLHGCVFYILLYALLNQSHADWRVPATLVVALLYGGFALALRSRPGMTGEFLHLCVTAAILIIVATGIQFRGIALVEYWTVEALALTWAGVQWRLRPVWYSGLALFALAFMELLGTAGALVISPSEPFTLVFNRRVFAFLLLAASLALGAIASGRSDLPGSGRVRTLLHLAWCWVLYILISAETMDGFSRMIRNAGVAHEQYLEFLRVMSLPVVWGAYSLALVLGGTRRAFRPIVISGLVILLVSTCVALLRGLAFSPISEFSPLMNWRAGLLLLFTAECIAARSLLGPRAGAAGAYAGTRLGLQIGTVLLFLVLLTGETWDYFSHAIYALAQAAGSVNITTELTRLQNLRQLFLSVAWLMYAIILMAIGIRGRSRSVRIEAIVLSGVAILKIFIYDLSFLDTLYRIFSFVGLGIVLLTVSYLYQRYRSVILGPGETLQ